MNYEKVLHKYVLNNIQVLVIETTNAQVYKLQYKIFRYDPEQIFQTIKNRLHALSEIV